MHRRFAALATLPGLDAWRRFTSRCSFAFRTLTGAPAKLGEDEERAFGLRIDTTLEQLLPVLGPVFGAVVILFGAWDYWIDADQAGATLRIRVALVLVGALGYAQGRLRWTVMQRCTHIYATHVGAMVLAAALLEDGLLLALPGITASMYPLALIEPRVRRCLAVMLLPSLLLVVLAAWALPPKVFLNSVLLYALSLALATAVASAQGRLRRARFMAGEALLHAYHHDSLSGALSRGHLAEMAERDLALARRHARPLAVAMLDIDYFKRINDRYGHATGDVAIRTLVATCRHAMRSSDYIGRVGGEEFACVMPETGTGHALACAERIRQLVSALSLPVPGGAVHFTVSLGVCMLDEHHPDWPTLLRDADAAMYAAKSAGRNRVVLFTPAAAPGS